MKNKTRIAVAAALIAGLGTSSALATDLYTPPAGVAVFEEPGTDWSGFYYGVYGEYTHVNVGPGVGLWGVGKRIGYNFDTGNISFGVEGAAEYQWQTPSWDVQVVGRLHVGQVGLAGQKRQRHVEGVGDVLLGRLEVRERGQVAHRALQHLDLQGIR